MNKIFLRLFYLHFERKTHLLYAEHELDLIEILMYCKTFFAIFKIKLNFVRQVNKSFQCDIFICQNKLKNCKVEMNFKANLIEFKTLW